MPRASKDAPGVLSSVQTYVNVSPPSPPSMNARPSFGSLDTTPSSETFAKHLGVDARGLVGGYGSIAAYTVTGAGGAGPAPPVEPPDPPPGVPPATSGVGGGGFSGGGGGNGGGAGGGAAYRGDSSRSTTTSASCVTAASGAGGRLQSTCIVTVPADACPAQLPVLVTLNTYLPGPSGMTLSLDA